MIISPIVCFISFFIIEILLFSFMCILAKADRLKNFYALVLFLLMIVLLVFYVKWNPSRLLIVDECEKQNPIYNKYFIISDYSTKEGLSISSKGGDYYVYNCSDYDLTYGECTYGYRGGSKYIIAPKTFKSVPAPPNYLFEQPPSVIKTKRNTKRLTLFYLDFKNDN